MRVMLPLLLLWAACGNGDEGGGGGAVGSNGNRGAPEPRAPRPIAADYREAIRAPQTYDFAPGLVFSYPKDWKVTPTLTGLTVAAKGRRYGVAALENCTVTLTESPRARGVMSTAFLRDARNLAATALWGYKEAREPGLASIGDRKWGMMVWEQNVMRLTNVAVLYTYLEKGRRISAMLRCLKQNLARQERTVLAMLSSMNLTRPRPVGNIVGRWVAEGGETEGEFDPVNISDMRRDGTFTLYRAELRDGTYHPTNAEKTRGRYCTHKGLIYEASSRTKGAWLETSKFKISGRPGERRMVVTTGKQEFVYNEAPAPG